MFTLSLNVKLFYLIHWEDPIRYYHSGSECTWEQRQWRGTLHSPKFQSWSLIIRLFNVIPWTIIGGISPLCRNTVGVFFSPSELGFFSAELRIVNFLKLKRIFKNFLKCGSTHTNFQEFIEFIENKRIFKKTLSEIVFGDRYVKYIFVTNLKKLLICQHFC